MGRRVTRRSENKKICLIFNSQCPSPAPTPWIPFTHIFVCHCDPEVRCCWQPGIKGFVVVLEKRYLNTKYNLNKNYGAIVQCWKKNAYTLCLLLQIQLRVPQYIAVFVLRKIKKSKEKHLTRTAFCSSWFYLFVFFFFRPQEAKCWTGSPG